MKKFRLLSTLLVGVFAISALSGCSGINDELPEPQAIMKDGLNIQSITIENIPNEIPVGTINSLDMYFKIVYSDNSEERYPLTLNTFPKSIKHLFNVVGQHTVTIAFRGNEAPYTFNVVPGKEIFAVTYYSYDGSIVQREELPVAEAYVTMPAPAAPDRPEDSLFIYTNPRWMQEVEVGTELFNDIDIYPIYDKAQKRYNSRELVPTNEGNPFRILRANGTTYYYTYTAWIHVGRLERVPLVYSEPVEKTTPSINASLFFDNETSQKITDNTDHLLREIHSKAFNVDTSNYYSYFKTGSASMISNPEIYNGGAMDIKVELANDDPLTMIKGDTSYTPLYMDNIYNFVQGLDEEHKDEFVINFPEDMLTTSANYYRGAIEGSVDIIAKIRFKKLDTVKFDLDGFEYFFLYDANKTFHTIEYSETTNFVAAGNKLSFNMDHLYKVLNDAMEYVS